MLIEYFTQQVPNEGELKTYTMAKKLIGLDRFGDLILIEAPFLFHKNDIAKFDINNIRADLKIKKTSCYRE